MEAQKSWWVVLEPRPRESSEPRDRNRQTLEQFDPQPVDYLVSQFEEMSAHIAAVVSDVDWDGLRTWSPWPVLQPRWRQ